MRFMITSGRGDGPAPEEPFDADVFARYMRFNEELQQAGVLVASEGLNPHGGRARVVARGGRREVVDGPFAETKELVGGFYVIEVASLDEAVAWALRCPLGMDSASVLDIHALTGAEDIPAELLALAASVAPTWVASFDRSR